MRLSIEDLLLDQDNLMSSQMKHLFRGLLNGGFSADFRRNNRPSIRHAQVDLGEAFSEAAQPQSQEAVSRATLALASMVLGGILHVTKHYKGTSAHGDE